MTEYTEDMHQTATHWPAGLPDGFGGTTYGTPEALLVRWQDQSSLFRDKDGREVTSEAVVYVPEPLDNGGKLYLGESTDAAPVSDAKEIRQSASTVDLDAGERLSKVWL